MKLSVLLPMCERPLSTVEAVMEGLKGQEADQYVFALDRCSPAIVERVRAFTGGPRVDVIELSGPPGWRSPCLTFNAALEAATGDICLLNQGDVVQAVGACAATKRLMTQEQAVYFGLVAESDPETRTGPGHAGPVLQGVDCVRTMTYLTAIPTEALRSIGGWDPAFMKGVWYEDDDVMARLWKGTLLPFIWTNDVAGVHQTHQRGYSQEEAISINCRIYLDKHGSTRFFWREGQLKRLQESRREGQVRYDHV